MRNVFAEEITRLGAIDQRLVLLSGDIGNRLFDRFKDGCPGRFLNCGIAEANMMGVAAGMALEGLRPVVYTIAPFTTTRCLEQIRVDACYNHAPVIIVGTGAGLSYAELGPTHHSCEDIAILRTLPGMTVFCPCDPVELRLGLKAALDHDGPVYIRLGKKGEPTLHARAPSLRLGEALTLRDGGEVCLIATGTLMAEVLRAADLLAEAGVKARVESFHTVKPLDEARLAEVFAGCQVVAAIEEHSRIGGLGGAIAEWLAARPAPPRARLLSCAVDDVFLHQVGSQDWARSLFGLTAETIAGKVRDALAAAR
ncbi:MAG: transketolase [Alphaproteobacteria bacterium]|nr:transketolase [Alphaproteobacteria bacterium]